MLKSFVKVVAGLLLIAGLSQAGFSRAEMLAPDVLIKSISQEVIDIVKKDSDIKAGNQDKVLALVDAKVLPHFDFVYMTRAAMGMYWSKASKEQKQALVTEFRNMQVRTYTKAFTLYRDQSLEVMPLALAPNDEDATVKMRILKQGSQATSVDYRMKKSSDGWKVVDVTIEGVGMINSQRGSFYSQIRQGIDVKSGIDGLIKTMSETNSTAKSKVDSK